MLSPRLVFFSEVDSVDSAASSLLPVPIQFHNGGSPSNIQYHNGTNIEFHNPYYSERGKVTGKQNAPRLTFAGEGDL